MRGFSLVELSIVLVILGLLTGGILTGQSLIRASELRAVSVEFQRYQASVQAFRDKYFAVPGDMRNAQSFWGIAHITAATCITTIGTGTQTCNGDGSGNLGVSTGSNENFRFWQHLANAGFIEGTYTGIEGSAGNVNHAVGGTNTPKSKVTNALWHINLAGIQSGNPSVFDGDYGNVMSFGGSTPTNSPSAGILKPEEAWNIDTKLDDGVAHKGAIWAGNWAGCTGAPNSATLTNYNLSSTAYACSIVFPKVF